MEISIRQVRKEDLDSVVKVEAACFPAAEAASRKSLEKRIETFPESFFVAQAQGKVIGFINGCVTDEKQIRDEMYQDSRYHKENGAYQSIFGLDVLPQYQRQGIAAKLMEHLISDAFGKGRKGLILTCKEKMIHYYEKFGYVNCGVSKSTHGGAVWYDMILEAGR